jgi:hypothetical protein
MAELIVRAVLKLLLYPAFSIIRISIGPSPATSDMAEPKPTYRNIGEIQQSFRRPRINHQLTGQHKEWYGHKCKGIYACKHSMDHNPGSLIARKQISK